MKLVISAGFDPQSPFVYQHVFNQIGQRLPETFPDIEWEWRQPIPPFHANMYPHSHCLMILNEETDKRIFLSYLDQPRFMLSTDPASGWKPETIQQLFTTPDIALMKKSQEERVFLHTSPRIFYEFENSSVADIKNYKEVLQPFSYVANQVYFEWWYAQQYRNERRPAREREGKLFFRGFSGWPPRASILNAGMHPEIGFNKTGELISPELYLKEMISYRCGFSLNGNGEICNRDIEYFGMGMPVIRPVLKYSEFADPLIPDVHYIAYDYARKEYPNDPPHCAGAPVGPWTGDATLVWNALVERWEQVKDDYDYLEWVGENALQWYQKNATLEANVTRFITSINLNLLR